MEMNKEMITKGTELYKMAQQVANDLVCDAKISKNDRNGWELFGTKIQLFCRKVMSLDCFAAKIAETVDNTCCNGFTAARISDKQAWILACAAVENGITY